VLESFGLLVHRYRWLILALTGTFLLAAIAMLLRGGPLTAGSIEGLEATRAQSLVDEVSGRPSDTTFIVVFRHGGRAVGLPAMSSSIARTVARVRADPHVALVFSPTDDAGSPLSQKLWNPGAGAALAIVTLKGDFAAALAAYPGVRSKLADETLEIDCTGKVPFTHDLNRTLEHDLLRAEVVSMPVALLVLLLVFRTLTAAVLPVGVGGLAVVGGIALVLVLAHHLEIAQFAINVCSLIGLGVAIDYSLFIVNRYREELAHGHDYPHALSRALATAGKTVLFSGVAVGTGMGGLFFFRGSYLFAMGIGGSLVILLAVLFALTFLPALLAVLGPKINAGRLRPHSSARTAGWHRMALFVMRRPLTTLVPTLGLLLLLGSPFLHLKLASADVRVLARDIEARQGFELLRHYFPEQAATRVELAVAFPAGDPLTPARLTALADLTQALAARPEVRRVESVLDVVEAARVGSAPGGAQPFAASSVGLAGLLASPPAALAPLVAALKKTFVGEHTTVVHVLCDRAPESEDARALVRFARSRRRVADGHVLVGGQTAQDLDATAFLLSRLPKAVAAIIGVTLVVLFLLLRSVILPLKAVVMNALSIVGSFGALVWIFQDGHLLVQEGQPLEPSLPVLLFCISFGLSMDYEVLMLSRMQEAHERSGDNVLSVAEGLEKSAGLITSAAAIMVTVFAAFALARVVLIQAVGVGMALAVAIDATLVRILLVPATMRLFGELNWWAPHFLARVAPRRSSRDRE
jgi:RND superfamily putative drug exporter